MGIEKFKDCGIEKKASLQDADGFRDAPANAQQWSEQRAAIARISGSDASQTADVLPPFSLSFEKKKFDPDEDIRQVKKEKAAYLEKEKDGYLDGKKPDGKETKPDGDSQMTKEKAAALAMEKEEATGVR